MWDPFLMKKLIKNEICGSVNSAYVHCSLQKVSICDYCSLNSNRNTPRRVKKKKKKKKEQNAAWKRRLEIQTHTKMHELKGSAVAVDSATPGGFYNLIFFLY